MDIVRYKGGIGNQMFQYAFQLSLENKGREVFASDGFYKVKEREHKFCLTDGFLNVRLSYVADEKFREIDRRWQKIKNNPEELSRFKADPAHRFFWVEEDNSKYNEDVYKPVQCTYVGYWQTEKYFSNIKEKVRGAFSFSITDSKVLDFEKQCLDRVSIHVRLGDYCNSPKLYGNICTREYYRKALSILRKKTGIENVVVFSDDLDSAYNLLGVSEEKCIHFPYKFNKEYRDWYDMYLMTKCRYNIIANSSFSWWGAWLNDSAEKIVIAPAKWLNGDECPDICPSGWIRL